MTFTGSVVFDDPNRKSFLRDTTGDHLLLDSNGPGSEEANAYARMKPQQGQFPDPTSILGSKVPRGSAPFAIDIT